MPKYEDYDNGYMRRIPYVVDMPWTYFSRWLENQEELDLELNPDFQRGHVWNVQQQIDYIEYIIEGGVSAKDIYFNHPNWMGNFEGDFVLVDGLQRITAVMDFLVDCFPIFEGYYHKDFESDPHLIHHSFRLHVNNLPTRIQVLEWYVAINSGGVIHTKDEMIRVEQLIKKEKSEKRKV